MNLYQVSILFLYMFNSFISATNNPTQFVDDVSINCGSRGTSAAQNGREWLGDVKTEGSSFTSSVISVDDPVPYKTARLSRSQFSYAFRVSSGQKIIRLHFNPASYRGFKRFKDLFGVEAAGFMLLSNFSASLTAYALGVNSFVKEYCINIEENRELDVIFTPASSRLLDTYAFINGIEIISVPDGLSYFDRGDHNIGVQVVGKSLVYVDNDTALELIHRLSIKQDDVSDMFGMWETVKPKRKASKTNNVTWKVSVDVGFRYLVRLHISEIGGVSFKVCINEMIVDTIVEVAREKGDEDDFPLSRDYVVMMKGNKHEGKKDLLISLRSNDKFLNRNGPVKGFEVMKLSNHDNSLASPNPMPKLQDLSYSTLRYLLQVLGCRNMIATIVTIVLVLVSIIVYILGQVLEASGTEEENKPSARAERLCRRFSLAEIEYATRSFSDAHLIGKGGFGKVYKGVINNGRETVAIKRLKPDSKQGAREFLTEIETLTELRHVNLVSLIGYCNEQWEMILVYEYMPGGTLADHLHKLARNDDNGSSLMWKQRLNICIGAGRGLQYLHTGRSLIHRDVKASNILLDESYIAKVSDFGLAKYLSISPLESHISTKVKGTFGYLDPDYLKTGQLTTKSDTYAFGVVLLEVLSGRRAVNPSIGEGERILTKWARENIMNGKANEIVASNLSGEISEDSLMTYVRIAERCLDDEPKKRPTMDQVVLQLDLALKQQEKSKSQILNRGTTTNDVNSNSEIPNRATTNDVVEENIKSSKDETMTKLVNDEPKSDTNDRRQPLVHKQSRTWLGFWNRDNRQVREAESFSWSFSSRMGLKEEMLMESLPEDLQREIRSRLLRVRMFGLLDESIVDAICVRLRIRIYMKGSKLLYEGGLVDKMVFIIRGMMESISEKQQSVVPLFKGDFCGGELLVWCLEHCYKDGKRIRITGQRLLSDRSVTCSTNVEAFVLRAADFEEVANLYESFLRSPHIQRAIRSESPYWRELAARRIQVVWRNKMNSVTSADSSSPSHAHSSMG